MHFITNDYKNAFQRPTRTDPRQCVPLIVKYEYYTTLYDNMFLFKYFKKKGSDGMFIVHFCQQMNSSACSTTVCKQVLQF